MVLMMKRQPSVFLFLDMLKGLLSMLGKLMGQIGKGTCIYLFSHLIAQTISTFVGFSLIAFKRRHLKNWAFNAC
jgi:hypothetical protein